MDRKKFLEATSILTLASFDGISLLNAALLDSTKRLPIVDTHQHLVDVKRFGENWSRPPIPGNYSIREYQKAIRGLNLVKAVYMEVAVAKDKRYEEALYAIELSKDKSNPTFAAVISADPSDPDFENYMSKFAGSPFIKGVRAGFTSPETIIAPQVIKNVKALGQMGMSLDFSLRPSWFSTMSKLVEACPGTNFLINHCGNVDPRGFLDSAICGKADHNIDEWIKDMTVLASHPNVFCKISGVATRVKGLTANAENLGPAINQCLDIFGPDKVMFASDWPWCLPATDIKNWVGVLKTVVASRSYDDQKKLFHDNAIKLYQI